MHGKIINNVITTLMIVLLGVSTSSTAQSDDSIKGIGIYECIGEECFKISQNELSCSPEDLRCRACIKACSQIYTSCLASASNEDQREHCKEQYDECESVCVAEKFTPKSLTKLKCQVEIINRRYAENCAWDRGDSFEIKKTKRVRVSIFQVSNVTVNYFKLKNIKTGKQIIYKGNLQGVGQAKKIPAGKYKISYSWRYMRGTDLWPKTFQAMIQF